MHNCETAPRVCNLTTSALLYANLKLYIFWLVSYAVRRFHPTHFQRICRIYKVELQDVIAHGQPAKSGKYYQQNTQNVDKTAACSHHCSLRHEHRHWGYLCTGVYLRIFNSGPSNSTTFLGFALRWLHSVYIVSNGCSCLQFWREVA